ncbi:MAG: DUF5995 family protein [Acidobacteriota bacterium]|nr:DUF5995 family protein [Acidobacteriota bacterium]
MAANPISDIIDQLTSIVAAAEAAGSRTGYFAALYRRVTITVLAGIDSFQDPARMTRLDVTFATRYLNAFTAYQQGQPLSSAWQTTFQAAQSSDPVILQHLLLGMNAHINLDLGIAAARTSPGQELPALHDDFMRINAVLASLIETVMGELGQVSPLLGLIGEVLGRDGQSIANFGIDTARDWAWAFAETLAPLGPAEQQAKIATTDKLVAGFAQALRHPEPVLAALYEVIRSRETDSVARVIAVLAAG